MKPTARDPSELPYVKFYVRDFLSNRKVASMTMDESGVHMTLLCSQWTDGPFPNDPGFIARLCGISGEEFNEVWPSVSRCYVQTEDGRLLFNPRMEREYEKAIKVHQAKAKGGLASAAARIGATGTAQPKASSEESPNICSNTCSTGVQQVFEDSSEDSSEDVPNKSDIRVRSSSSKRKGARKRAPIPWTEVLARPEYAKLRPSPVFQSAWNRWIAWTETAGAKASTPIDAQAAGILNKAVAWGPGKFSAAVDNAIAGNWAGLFEPKDFEESGKSNRNDPAQVEKWRRYAASPDPDTRRAGQDALRGLGLEVPA